MQKIAVTLSSTSHRAGRAAPSAPSVAHRPRVDPKPPRQPASWDGILTLVGAVAVALATFALAWANFSAAQMKVTPLTTPPVPALCCPPPVAGPAGRALCTRTTSP